MWIRQKDIVRGVSIARLCRPVVKALFPVMSCVGK